MRPSHQSRSPPPFRSSTLNARLYPSLRRASGRQQRDVLTGGAIDLDEVASPEKRPQPIEEPPRPLPVPPVERPPLPMQASNLT